MNEDLDVKLLYDVSVLQCHNTYLVLSCIANSTKSDFCYHSCRLCEISIVVRYMFRPSWSSSAVQFVHLRKLLFCFLYCNSREFSFYSRKSE
jgi:hypothetical protein